MILESLKVQYDNYSPYHFNAKEVDPETGYHYYGARYYNSNLSIWLSVDPLADKFPAWTPYDFVHGNPVMLIDPNGLSPTEVFDEYGKKVGEDENGKDGKVAIVSFDTGKKLRQGEITAEEAIASGVQTTYDELQATQNAHLRQKDNGGDIEEGAVVSQNGLIHDAEPNSADRGTELTLPEVEGNNNTSIHGHPYGYEFDPETNKYSSHSAYIPSDRDEETFKGYQRNIIYGRLGLTTGTYYSDGTISPNQPNIGAVFYDRSGTYIGEIEMRYLGKILRKK